MACRPNVSTSRLTQNVVQNGRYTTVVVVVVVVLVAAVAAAVDHTWRRAGRFGDNIYGPGRGRIWLDDVVCIDGSRNIESCDHRPWGVHDCTHRQDVSVLCVTGMKLIATTQVRACANRVVIIIVDNYLYNGIVSVLSTGAKLFVPTHQKKFTSFGGMMSLMHWKTLP